MKTPVTSVWRTDEEVPRGDVWRLLAGQYQSQENREQLGLEMVKRGQICETSGGNVSGTGMRQ